MSLTDIEVLKIFSKILELQKLVSQQAELVLIIADARAKKADLESVHGERSHLRDHHQQTYDMSAYLEISEEFSVKNKDNRGEYRKISRRILALEAEIAKLLTIPG